MPNAFRSTSSKLWLIILLIFSNKKLIELYLARNKMFCKQQKLFEIEMVVYSVLYNVKILYAN